LFQHTVEIGLSSGERRWWRAATRPVRRHHPSLRLRARTCGKSGHQPPRFYCPALGTHDVCFFSQGYDFFEFMRTLGTTILI